LASCEGTYGEAVSRISQVARDQDFTALKELQVCREQHKKVGLRYAKALKNSKVEAMKYSCVEQISPLTTTQFFVKDVTRAPNPSGEFNCYYSIILTLPRKSSPILVTVKYYLETFL